MSAYQDYQRLRSSGVFDDNDEEDRLSTVIMVNRMVDGQLVPHVLQHGASPKPLTGLRQLRHDGEEEGVLLCEEDPTPGIAKRPIQPLAQVGQEWEVTEQMPMPSANPPHLRRAVSAPRPSPARHADTPTRTPVIRPRSHAFDLTPELTNVRRRGRSHDWSELSDTPPTLNNQPKYWRDEDILFAPLIALIAVPSFLVFGIAMWFVA